MSTTMLVGGISDSSYRESIEYSANFNRRLCSERRMRMPFLDPQTGVAQAHSTLFMDRRQRMPGFREGQLYSYPAARWRKSRRQYLNKTARPFGSVGNGKANPLNTSSSPAMQTPKRSSAIAAAAGDASNMSMGDATDSNDYSVPAFLDQDLSLGATSDSKDSQLAGSSGGHKEELSKEWFYDDMDMHEMDGLEEPKSPADDEFDYDPRYGHKKKKRKPAAVKKSTGQGRGGHRGGMAGSAAGGSGASGSSKGRGAGGRRKTGGPGRKEKSGAARSASPSSTVEPPSFEMAAATFTGLTGADGMGYRKYL